MSLTLAFIFFSLVLKKSFKVEFLNPSHEFMCSLYECRFLWLLSFKCSSLSEGDSNLEATNSVFAVKAVFGDGKVVLLSSCFELLNDSSFPCTVAPSKPFNTFWSSALFFSSWSLPLLLSFKSSFRSEGKFANSGATNSVFAVQAAFGQEVTSPLGYNMLFRDF